jgi:hypothetical protein
MQTGVAVEEGAVHPCCPGDPGDGDGVPRGSGRVERLDYLLLALGAGELTEAGLNAADQLADELDLGLGRDCFGAGPIVQVTGNQNAFTVAEEVLQVSPEVGQIGGVGEEVAAVGAAEPERAGVPAGLDVGGLGADPVCAATWPICSRARSSSSRAWAWRQIRLPCRSNCSTATLSTAARVRFSVIR